MHFKDSLASSQSTTETFLLRLSCQSAAWIFHEGNTGSSPRHCVTHRKISTEGFLSLALPLSGSDSFLDLCWFSFSRGWQVCVFTFTSPLSFIRSCCILILIRQKKSVISMIMRVLTSRARIFYMDRDGLTPASCRWRALTVWGRHAGWSGTFLLIADVLWWAPSGMVTSLCLSSSPI